MERLFGTDGIRAVAGEYPLDYSTVYVLGKALISLLQEKHLKPKVIIGRDTRESGEWLEQALFQGILESGGEAATTGIIPTSAISFLAKKYSFSAGIVISASHNPYQDNGIKIFSAQGTKVSDEWETKIENVISSERKDVERKKIDIIPASEFIQDYSEFLKSQFSPVQPLKEIKIVLDCANGASSFLAPKIFQELGFDIISIGDTPNGKNINSGCGSLYPQNLAMKVQENKADIGIAYDGDADRAIWTDEKGKILNGDHTLYILSKYMKDTGRLKSDYVVATTMSNLGLEKILETMGLKLYRTQVGDKYVLEQMIKLRTNLGGEQSGHTIFLDDCPTGDGILTSIKMLEVIVAQDAPLSKLMKNFIEFPQIYENVRVIKKKDFSQFPEIMKTMEEITNQLGDSGRLNVRYSGTEPLARIMIEGSEKEKIEHCARRMADVIARHLGE